MRAVRILRTQLFKKIDLDDLTMPELFIACQDPEVLDRLSATIQRNRLNVIRDDRQVKLNLFSEGDHNE
jgi:hypothetical protein